MKQAINETMLPEFRVQPKIKIAALLLHIKILYYKKAPYEYITCGSIIVGLNETWLINLEVEFQSGVTLQNVCDS